MFYFKYGQEKWFSNLAVDKFCPETDVIILTDQLAGCEGGIFPVKRTDLALSSRKILKAI